MNTRFEGFTIEELACIACSLNDRSIFEDTCGMDYVLTERLAEESEEALNAALDDRDDN